MLFVFDQLGKAAARDRDAIVADAGGLADFGFELFGGGSHVGSIAGDWPAVNAAVLLVASSFTWI
jgi:hypothetical protein